MENLGKSEKKVKFIVDLFKLYQPNLTIPEQVSLLNMWSESCLVHEEYEMVAALKKQLDKIKLDPNKVPQKKVSDTEFKDISPDPKDIIDYNIVEPDEEKEGLFYRFVKFFKRLFNK